MNLSRVAFPAWLLLGVFLPAGMWMAFGGVLLLIAIADENQWTIARTTVVGVVGAIAITCVQLLIGGS